MLHVAQMCEDPERDHQLTRAFMLLDATANAVAELGLKSHSAFVYLWVTRSSERARSDRHRDWGLLEKIIYRQDLQMKYERFPQARRQHAIAEKALELPVIAKKAVRPPVSLDDVLCSNGFAHLKIVAKD